ncbi:MAG: TAXI family TRAP transporter solute-binding subunit [bacterium]
MTMATKSVGIAVVACLLLTPLAAFSAAPQIRLSIATGPPGSPDLEVGSALARVISHNIPNVAATAEVTGGHPDNIRLIGTRRADLGFTGSVIARDAFLGEGEVQGTPLPVRTLTPVHDLFIHLITVEGAGINAIEDLRGRRVSLGPAGTPLERNALRILEAAGLNHERDMRKEQLSVAAAVGAVRDKRIDAFFAFGPLPIPAVLDLATTPGIRIKLIPLDAVLPALQKEFGKRYIKVTIRKEFYPGMTADVPTVGPIYLLLTHQDFNADLAYQITRLIYEKRGELVQGYRYAQYITLIGVADRSPIPFHPGAIRYFKEREVEGF